MNKLTTIIWDWNGTLLDDIDLSISLINAMLCKHGLNKLTPEQYRSVFDFPVIEYYRKLGFDVDNHWEELAREYIISYNKYLHTCSLHIDAEAVLERFAQHNFRQFVLSAMEHDALNRHIESCNIAHLFNSREGIRDIYARGKIETGRKMLEKFKINPSETLLVGDTVHDFEVGDTLGTRVALVERGHHSKKRLAETSAHLFSSLSECADHFLSP